MKREINNYEKNVVINKFKNQSLKIKKISTRIRKQSYLMNEELKDGFKHIT